MADATLTGREYLRVSRDRSGQQRSVAEQHDDNRQAAARRGVTLREPYAERDAISASRYGGRTRAGFARLLADLQAGRFGADELWLWESSRGSRKTREWVDLVDALEAAGVTVHVTSHGRVYDPAVPRDRRSLLEDAVDSEYEVAKSSSRLRRAKAASAAAGTPGRGLGYGWTPVHDPVSGARRYVIDPTEAAVIREMYRRVAAGESMSAISRDLTARGVRTRSGTEWTNQRIRPTLLREAYKGVRVHRPGSQHGSPTQSGPVHRAPATWPPIVEPVLWQRVHAILTSRKPTSPRSGRAHHLLSRIAVCDVCGTGLVAQRQWYTRADGTRTWVYRCPGPGHTTVPEAELDRFAERLMLGYLTRPDVAESLAAAAASTVELDAARAELADVDRELADLYREVSAGRLSASALAAVEPGLLARKAAAEDRVAELSAPPALAGILKPGPGAARRWKALTIEQHREVARILLAPGLLGELRIQPGGRGHRRPVEDRVTLRRAP